MPSRRALDGEFHDIAHPIKTSTREMIQDVILNKYQEVTQEIEAEGYMYV